MKSIKGQVSRVKGFLAAVLAIGLFFVMPTAVFAHAVVKPSEVGIGSYTDFSLGVPSEKDAATVSIKLMIPEGINSVSPIVKPGWKVEVINSTKQGEPDDDGNVTPIPEAIIWTGGLIPAHQKDFFMFSTQVPAKEKELDWKIEQTYSDGTVMSWSKTAEDQPKDGFGPFSKTMVVNDLKASPQASPTAVVQSSSSTKLPLMLSGLAILFSAVALFVSLKKGKV